MHVGILLQDLSQTDQLGSPDTGIGVVEEVTRDGGQGHFVTSCVELLHLVVVAVLVLDEKGGSSDRVIGMQQVGEEVKVVAVDSSVDGDQDELGQVGRVGRGRLALSRAVAKGQVAVVRVTPFGSVLNHFLLLLGPLQPLSLLVREGSTNSFILEAFKGMFVNDDTFKKLLQKHSYRHSLTTSSQ